MKSDIKLVNSQIGNGSILRRQARVRWVCSLLPPLLASSVRSWLYPMRRAYADDAEFAVSSISGSLFSGRSSDFHGYPFSVQGYYEWRNIAIALAVCREGETILEIGANVGTETVGFVDVVGKAGRVFPVEPFPENIKRLKHLVDLNGWLNVEILPMALSDCAGTLHFVSPPNRQSTGVGHIQAVGEKANAPVLEVACARLDELAAKIGTVHAVFMDSEGAEVSILRGGNSWFHEMRPYLILEVAPKLLHRTGSSVEELRQILNGLDYCYYAITRFGLEEISTSSIIKSANWFCVPIARKAVASRVGRTILKCGLLPPFLNPLALKKRKQTN